MKLLWHQSGLLLGLCLSLVLAGWCPVLPPRGGGQTNFQPPRALDPMDVALLEGYRIEVVATGLTFPTGVAFDEAGQVCIVEAGYAYGEAWYYPRIVEETTDKRWYSNQAEINTKRV